MNCFTVLWEIISLSREADDIVHDKDVERRTIIDKLLMVFYCKPVHYLYIQYLFNNLNV